MKKAAKRGKGKTNGKKLVRGGLASIGKTAAADTSRFWGTKPLNSGAVKPVLGEVSMMKGC